jgi:hypothetical protein
MFAPSLGENATRFGSETRVVEVLIEQLLDLVRLNAETAAICSFRV